MTYTELRDLADAHDATLVAVSKTKPVGAILELYEQGQRDFGENYVQELVDKQAQLPQDIRWHFVGHLQRNKVRQIAPFVELIHGVDSLRLLEEINKRGKAGGKIINVLIQVHVAREETKHGFDADDVLKLFADQEIHRLAWCRMSGLMGMASNTPNQAEVAREFGELHELYTTIKQRYYGRRPDWNVLSMGMSGDYELALKQRSNMLRIGSLLFGARE